MSVLQLLKNNQISGKMTQSQALEIYNEIKSDRKKYIDYITLSNSDKRKMDSYKFNQINEELDKLAEITRKFLHFEVQHIAGIKKINKKIEILGEKATQVFKKNPQTKFSFNEIFWMYIIETPMAFNNFEIEAKPAYLILREWFPEKDEGDLFMNYLFIRQSEPEIEQIMKIYTYLKLGKSKKYKHYI